MLSLLLCSQGRTVVDLVPQGLGAFPLALVRLHCPPPPAAVLQVQVNGEPIRFEVLHAASPGSVGQWRKQKKNKKIKSNKKIKNNKKHNANL